MSAQEDPMLRDGKRGVSKNLERSAQLLEIAVQHGGGADAQYNLGLCFETGKVQY